ncbi:MULTISPECIES: PH domain-containing protein [Paenibacillus]|uniref:PH domain-containing protein n=1 Tax=Paenibacillus TaxID=44249 RepID=UPI0015E84D73|nr:MULTISPECIES: PH domain-containing protein [unclassified Paenibacillus]
MKFSPRRDLWLSIVIWSSILVLLISGLSPFFKEGAGIIGGTLIFLLCYSMAGFLAWLWTATYYVLNESDLFIRTGPVTQSIPFESIAKVKPIRSWMASAATSSRRIEINYGSYDYIHISPLDEEAFLTELKKRCPHLHMETR